MKDGKEGKVRDVGEEIIETAGALSVSYTEDVQEQLDEMLGSLNIVMVVLVVSAGMLAFVVLYSLNNINITERARELATLKVLGFYDREVSSYVFRENILLTVLGAIVGIFLGQFLHRFIIVTVEVESAMFGRNIDPSSFVYSFLITMAFSLFVNLVMHAKLKRINMVESLKSVE
jgi:putative ABC transport system permease protein